MAGKLMIVAAGLLTMAALVLAAAVEAVRRVREYMEERGKRW